MRVKFSKIACGIVFFSGNDVENDFRAYEKIISRTTCKKFILKFILTFMYCFL